MCIDLCCSKQYSSKNDCVYYTNQTEAHDNPEGNKNYFPTPGDKAIQAEGKKYKLKNIDWAEKLKLKLIKIYRIYILSFYFLIKNKFCYLKWSVMLDCPYTNSYGHYRYEDERDEDKDP